MCGIVGYIGHINTGTRLINLLKNLEYRGYDSSGVAVQTDDDIKITKAEGKIANLEKIIKPDNAFTGIAHTRWATHGKPTTINAHPHHSFNKDWVVVHNGIIENFEVLKKNIENTSNIKFISETDTEVIPQLLEFCMQENFSPIDTLIDVCNMLKGSYAIACLNKNLNNHLLLAKKKSPLYVASNGDEIFVASDPICFNNKVTQYYMLEEDEFCDASKDGIYFYNNKHEKIAKNLVDMDEIDELIGKQDYPHFMLKEINEIPSVLRRIVKIYRDSDAMLKFDKDMISRYNKIVLIGCGTAYHVALMGAKYIEKYARIDARAFIASEFRYTNPLIDEKTLCIFVSQSGETADTIAAEELARSKGATTIALTNVLYSTLAKKVDIVLPVCAGHEIAVASTKAYNAQVAIMYMFSRQLYNVLNSDNFDYLTQLENLAKTITLPDEKNLICIAEDLLNETMSFFIGRDLDYITSEEASLKLKEITYINSSAYPSGELKHGFLALIEKGTPLFVIATEKDLLDKTLNGAHEAYARGAKVILVTQLDIEAEKSKFVNNIIKLPQYEEDLLPIVSIIIFQLISYYVSVLKGNNPDQPRNLAKSVTVE